MWDSTNRRHGWWINQICNNGVTSTNFNRIGILVLFTLKMTIWVAETCLWLGVLCKKITLINPEHFWTLVDSCAVVSRATEHIFVIYNITHDIMTSVKYSIIWTFVAVLWKFARRLSFWFAWYEIGENVDTATNIMDRMSHSIITRQMLQYVLKVKSTQYIDEKIHFLNNAFKKYKKI
jgi:hypothetical protein